MSQEIELKLELGPGDADALEASELLPGEPDIASQVSIYFDTPGRALELAGISLRIRKTGKTRIQTVKAQGAAGAGLFARGEWERPVTGDTPVIDNATPLQALLGDRTSELALAFEVRVERRTWNIDSAEARIELVLDRGTVCVGDRETSICEVELELKHGAPAALFALAQRIDAVAPVRLGVLTKAQRGYGLSQERQKSVKAGRIVLADSLTAAQAFQAIALACVRHFRLNEARLLEARDAEALHQARVALRRLRSAFSIFKPLIDGDAAVALRQELRWLVAQLGDARNLDVLLDRAQPGPLHDRIAAAREAAYDRVEATLRAGRVRALMLDLAEWLAVGDWLGSPEAAPLRDQPAREYAAHALRRFRRKLKRGGRKLGRLDDEARHEVRKDAKKLRYAAEFFAGLFADKRERRRWKKFVAALEEMQEQLGALNDLVTAPDVLAQLGIADEPGAAELLGDGRRSALIKAGATAYDDLIDTKRFWR